jgi:transposase
MLLELRRRTQPVEKRARRESAKRVSPLAWPPVPRRRPRYHDGHQDPQLLPLPHDLSLEDLVPEDNFYRRLQARLDLSFVGELVGPLYAKGGRPSGGRPSVDPVVFFKLQLVMFFEDICSERQLMGIVADRLSLRWYLGYDFHEPLPDHSSLTRIRERYGLSVFRQHRRLRPRPTS